ARQCRQPQPVARFVTDSADLAAQDHVLVPEHQELGILGHLVPGQHHQIAEQTTYEQVDNRNDHSAMIPAGKSVQARSSNRAPQGKLRSSTHSRLLVNTQRYSMSARSSSACSASALSPPDGPVTTASVPRVE